MGLELHDTMADFDFSSIFDDEPLDPWPLEEEPQLTTAVENKMVDAVLQDTSCGPQVPQDITPPTVPQPSLFNLYMIVDPSTGQFSMCPKQMLTFKNSINMPTTTVGPSLFNQSTMSNGLLLGNSHQQHQRTFSSNINLPVVQPLSHEMSPFPMNYSKLARPTVPTIVNGPPNTVMSQTCSMNQVSKVTRTASLVDATKLPVLRALSAYNFFFQAERDKILNGSSADSKDVEDDWSDLKKQQILQTHWSRDRTKKRRHRKSHGRISFIELSKEISSRWKKLSDEQKEFYRDIAALDFARYQRETKEPNKEGL
jgi:hypothetical protein